MYRPTRPPLSPTLMLRAYAAGIFPMSEGADDPTLFWVDPQRRGVFPLDGFHVSRSLRRRIRKGGFEVRVNSDFLGTLEGCADREPTWINAEIFRCYMSLHAMGRAHSVEVWEDGALVGRRLRRRAGRGVLRRVDVLAAQGRLQDRARVADRASQLRRLPPVRHAIRDRAPGIAGRCGTAAPHLSRPSPRRWRSQRISTRCRGTCRLRTCSRISAPRRRNADAPAR
jgi:hypothetical protein